MPCAVREFGEVEQTLPKIAKRVLGTSGPTPTTKPQPDGREVRRGSGSPERVHALKAMVVQGVPYPPGAWGADFLIDRKCAAEVPGCFLGVIGQEGAASSL
jgi:hypothetical protein